MIQQLEEALTETLGSMGIHVQGVSWNAGVATHEVMDDKGDLLTEPVVDLDASEGSIDEKLSDMVRDGHGMVNFFVSAKVNNLAWTDRILYPNKHETDLEAASMIETQAERVRRYIREQMDAGVELSDIEIPEEYLDGA